MITIKKEIRYLLSPTIPPPLHIAEKKEQLIRQGYLTVVVTDGTGKIQKGLELIIRNHSQ